PATRAAEADGVHHVYVDGMTCRSCEITIERKFKRVRGVRRADADAARGVVKIVCEGGCVPDVGALRAALKGHDYSVRSIGSADDPVASAERPSLARLVGLFALVLLLGSMLSKLGLFTRQAEVGATIGVAAALVLGLVAGSSSCIAVSGGLLLSSAAKFRERYGGLSAAGRMRPVFMFVAGRTLSYAFLGGVIGAVGKAFTPSPLVTGALIVAAAAFMLIMGLDMLKIAPPWLKSLLPRMPKSLSHRIMDAEGKEHPVMPALLGAATFFLPCGFTQSLQLYALTTGSFMKGALVLGAFALGTAPALLALGWASSSLKGTAGKLFFQFSGALVVVLGLWNIQNGFTVAGYPLSLPTLSPGTGAIAAGVDDGAQAPAVVAGKQVITMDVGGPNSAYYPDVLTVKAGIPVRWEINGVNVGGCISYLQSRKLGVGIQLKPGLNVVEFTPPAPGSYLFSCSMGMFRGTINVI
ncbi:MAG TPA: sulfite exporter TauE/SafE family protein, partial [Patescibacteria group bacterium]|nr:sulfite exporter TauE/SafE family protein [Patescibacteria group bacterium]